MSSIDEHNLTKEKLMKLFSTEITKLDDISDPQKHLLNNMMANFMQKMNGQDIKLMVREINKVLDQKDKLQNCKENNPFLN